MWHYLFYIAYIHDKPETELTGIESYVYNCHEKLDIHWFPLSDESNSNGSSNGKN